MATKWPGLVHMTGKTGHLQPSRIVEGSERLLQAAVHADTVAQLAVTSLDELTRRTQRDELTGAINRTLRDIRRALGAYGAGSVGQSVAFGTHRA